MSEQSGNDQRKYLLKDIIKGLHEGRPVEEVRQQFTELVKIANSGEIAEVEQMLMAEGVPVSEIQRLCDLHVSIVRQSLDEQQSPETIPGHPVFTFKAENRIAENMLQAVGQNVNVYQRTPDETNRAKLQEALSRLAGIEKHYLRKENLLFPVLERYGFTGPSQVMWGIHDQIRAGIKQMGGLLVSKPGVQNYDNAQQVVEAYESFKTMLKEMIYKEEKILFPAALDRLNDDDWVAIHDQEEELGFFIVQPANQWKAAHQVILEEETGASQRSSLSGSETAGLIGLDTGVLTTKQINLLLTNLPVDVTFVDENDEVRFFSQTRERIFERQPAIIGRKVQLCHPPKSLDKVQRIIDDFRAGKRDVAEFWFEMMGKFIHIHYFALRDNHGAYCGTIEVSQDVSGIRGLNGERRLLDD